MRAGVGKEPSKNIFNDQLIKDINRHGRWPKKVERWPQNDGR